MKKFIISIILIILFTLTCYAESNIAIVGNSQAYYLSKICKIDDNKGTLSKTDNAVGGCFIDSTFPEIAMFPQRCKNYNKVILFFGTNEILKNYDLWDYILKINKYCLDIHKVNSDCKIYIIEIPKFKTQRVFDSKINLWNTSLELMCSNYKYIKYQKLPNKVEFKDELHLSDITLLELMQNILLNI